MWDRDKDRRCRLGNDWIAQAQQVGLGGKVGEQLIEDVIGRTESVIDEVGGLLSDGFPMDVAEAIFSGMRRHSTRLASAS